MEHKTSSISGLPENAYRELNPGEEYIPVMPSKEVFPEVTPYSVGMGLLMAVIFSAAAAFSGLKIGQVFEAAIPISIIAVGTSTFLKKKYALSQNVIIQSIGASSGVIVAGAIFTIPGLYILQYKYPEITVNFWQIFFSSLLGGFLGILFLIPFRKYFVKDMHGKFPFPEATATTEILITGEKGGKQAGILIVSGLIGGIFDFMFTSLKLWSEVVTTKILPIGASLYEKSKIVLKLNVSSLIFSFGYLVGLKFSTIIVVGSLLSWLVFIPLLNAIGGIVTGVDGTNFFASMTPEDIFRSFVGNLQDSIKELNIYQKILYVVVVSTLEKKHKYVKFTTNTSQKITYLAKVTIGNQNQPSIDFKTNLPLSSISKIKVLFNLLYCQIS